MKRYLLALLIVPALMCAMEDEKREAFLAEARQLEVDLLSGTVDPADLLKRSEDLRLRCQDEGLDSEGVERVNYNPKMNSIVAWNHRTKQDGKSVTITVIKYLDDERFDVNTSTHDYSSGLMGLGIANPSIVQKLKEKISIFESQRK